MCEDAIGNVVTDASCPGSMPPMSQTCGTQPCPLTNCNSGYSLFNGSCVPTVSQPVITATFAQMTSGEMAGSQLDAPLVTYPGGSYWLGTNWNCGQTRGGLSHTRVLGSLNNPYASIAWVKPTCVYNGSGYCADAPSGTHPVFTTFAPNLTDVMYL